MKPNIFTTAKFWIGILDAFISLGLLVAGWYLVPADLDKVVAVIAIVQPVLVTLIYALGKEDQAQVEMLVRENELIVAESLFCSCEGAPPADAVKQ